jgi:hypothetical protein
MPYASEHIFLKRAVRRPIDLFLWRVLHKERTIFVVGRAPQDDRPESGTPETGRLMTTLDRHATLNASLQEPLAPKKTKTSSPHTNTALSALPPTSPDIFHHPHTLINRFFDLPRFLLNGLLLRHTIYTKICICSSTQ